MHNVKKRYEGFVMRDVSKISFDRWGRVRIPSDFLKTFKEKFENGVFVTSMDDINVRIYPLTAWLQLAGGLDRGKRNDPLLRQFLMKTSYNGQKARIDRYGKVQIPGFLRKKVKMEGKIAISQREDHLELKPASM